MHPSVSTSFLGLLSIATFCHSQNVNHAIISSSYATDNPFDGGLLGSCEVPNTTLCSSVVNYAVPTSIARLAGIIEQRIRSEANPLQEVSESCRIAYETVLCNIHFPRCQQLQEGSSSLYLQVELNRQNCSAVYDACPVSIADTLAGTCNYLPHATVNATACRPVLQMSGSSEFEYCNVEGSSLVTEWMFAYMKYLDQLFVGVLYDNPTCGVNLATFMCTWRGQCSANEERIELINTHETCNQYVEW